MDGMISVNVGSPSVNSLLLFVSFAVTAFGISLGNLGLVVFGGPVFGVHWGRYFLNARRARNGEYCDC